MLVHVYDIEKYFAANRTKYPYKYILAAVKQLPSTTTDHRSKISTGAASETTFGMSSVVTEISNSGKV